MQILFVTFIIWAGSVYPLFTGPDTQRPHLFPASAQQQPVTPTSADEKQEWAQLLERFRQPQSYNLLTSQMWGLTHGGDPKKVEEILTLFNSFQQASLKQETGSAREFKNKIATFLNSDDDLVAGFAATLLGISGDHSFAPAIAKLLDKKDPPEDLEHFVPPIMSRGTAAFALSLMGAREYVPKFVAMLKSKDDYDRAGAVTALGQLHAKEHAKDVAELLKPENRGFGDDDSPIYALMEMGVGEAYSAEFAKALRDDSGSETIKTAAYALAKLQARKYTKDIAALLNRQYVKADAARVLAIMGATEYADQIARLLEDESGLNRSAALTALGIMGAKKYESQIAEHLSDSESYVPIHAAYALVLLNADRYADRIIPMVEHLYRENLIFEEEKFHSFVQDDVKAINNRFRESFVRMKGHR
jgi:HEAT repeat protein